MASSRMQVRHGLEIEEIFGYSQGIVADGLVYVAGQIGRGPDGQPIPAQGLKSKFDKTLENMTSVLHRTGSGLERLAYIQVHVTLDFRECWPELAEIHRRHFGVYGPASTVVGVDGLNHPDYLVEISAIAATTEEGEKGMERTSQAPRTRLQQELGAAESVRVGRHLFVSGQMATDSNGELADADNVAGQFRLALRNLGEALERAGATLDDVVSTHMFLTEFPDEAGFEEICKAHKAAFGGDNRPSGTMVYVPRLPLPGAMVEVTAVAVAS